MLSASTSISLTNTSITNTNSSNLNQEVSNFDVAVTKAAGQGLYNIIYNATTIGNPPADPSLPTTTLTTAQTQFKNLLQSSGYIIGINNDTGYWSMSWQNYGPETIVGIYTVITTISFNNTLQNEIIATIANFFNTQVPTITVKTNYIAGVSLQTNNIFYVVASNGTNNLTSGLNSALLAIGAYGFNSGNLLVNKVI